MKGKVFMILILLLAGLTLRGQEKDTGFMKAFNNISEAILRAQLGFLSSDEMEGRKAGEKGEITASDYIASQLQLFGVAPWGDSATTSEDDEPFTVNGRTYFQNFSLRRITAGENAQMIIIEQEGATAKKTFPFRNVDFYIRYPDQDIEIEAPVVFAGYGFKSDKFRCNDFEKLDIRGKFVVRVTGCPGFARENMTLSEIESASREAESIARQMGAAGIIEINPGRPYAGIQKSIRSLNTSAKEQRPFPSPVTGNYRLPENSPRDAFLRIIINAATGEELLKGSGTTLSEYISKSASSYVSPVPLLKNKSISVKTDVRTEVIPVRNVIGIIEGRRKDEFIVLGAHYDHMGTADGFTWNGADDNGSGTVGVMTIAKAIVETGIRPEKSVIIALWTAEEEGLLGSRYFVGTLPFPKSQIRLNMNFDMISRYVSEETPGKAVVTYTSNYPVFRTITENNLKKLNIGLDADFQPSDNPPGGSDHRSFVEARIPVFRIKPGHREEYHTPFDEASTVDWDIMEKIVRVSFANVWDLANSEW